MLVTTGVNPFISNMYRTSYIRLFIPYMHRFPDIFLLCIFKVKLATGIIMRGYKNRSAFFLSKRMNKIYAPLSKFTT